MSLNRRAFLASSAAVALAPSIPAPGRRWGAIYANTGLIGTSDAGLMTMQRAREMWGLANIGAMSVAEVMSAEGLGGDLSFLEPRGG